MGMHGQAVASRERGPQLGELAQAIEHGRERAAYLHNRLEYLAQHLVGRTIEGQPDKNPTPSVAGAMRTLEEQQTFTNTSLREAHDIMTELEHELGVENHGESLVEREQPRTEARTRALGRHLDELG